MNGRLRVMVHKLLGPVDEFLPFIVGAFRCVVILAVGYLLSVLINRGLKAVRKNAVHLMENKGQVHDLEMEKRANTVVTVMRRPLLLLLWAAVILTALDEAGFHVGALLAGAGISAGIIGVAVGFGSQTLIKDMIAGMFMLLENQIRVNDVAVINGTGGLVEEINLRTTVLRGENGAVHIFPNGSILTLSNLTREYAFYVFEISLRFEEDIDVVVAILREIGEQMRQEEEYRVAILDALEVMGIDRFLATGLVLKARIKTLPQRQWMVGREFNRRMRSRFTESGIVQPSQTNVLRLEQGAGSEQLRALVREVLDERGREGTLSK